MLTSKWAEAELTMYGVFQPEERMGTVAQDLEVLRAGSSTCRRGDGIALVDSNIHLAGKGKD